MFVFKGLELKKEIEGSVLFENINIEINEGEHTALIGNNGIGKTTLLRAIMGHTEFDGGTIQRRIPQVSWGYIEQTPSTVENTVIDYVQSEDESIYKIKKHYQCMKMIPQLKLIKKPMLNLWNLTDIIGRRRRKGF